MLRDMNGDFKGAFTNHYGIDTNNRAELRAILDSIRLCKNLSHYNVIIESDFRIIVDLFTAEKCTLWYLWKLWEDWMKEM